MKDLNYFVETAKEMLKELGIEIGNITEIKVNSRAKRRWGQCKRKNDSFYISINYLLLNDYAEDDALLNTLIHEMLHTVDGCFNHGVKWKSLADKVNKKYGLNIKRTSSAEEKGEFVAEIAQKERETAKYCLACVKCGYKLYRNRTSKFVRNPEAYWHTNCGGQFTLI